MKISLSVMALFFYIISLQAFSACLDNNPESDQTLVVIENSFEDLFYTLSVNISCEGDLLSLIKRVYDKETSAIKETQEYPLVIGREQVMIQRLGLKDIIRFKILELDPGVKGKTEVSYAANILLGTYHKIVIHFKKNDGRWFAFTDDLKKFNYLFFNIQTFLGAPTTVSLDNPSFREFDNFEK